MASPNTAMAWAATACQNSGKIAGNISGIRAVCVWQHPGLYRPLDGFLADSRCYQATFLSHWNGSSRFFEEHSQVESSMLSSLFNPSTQAKELFLCSLSSGSCFGSFAYPCPFQQYPSISLLPERSRETRRCSCPDHLLLRIVLGFQSQSVSDSPKYFFDPPMVPLTGFFSTKHPLFGNGA